MREAQIMAIIRQIMPVGQIMPDAPAAGKSFFMMIWAAPMI